MWCICSSVPCKIRCKEGTVLFCRVQSKGIEGKISIEYHLCSVCVCVCVCVCVRTCMLCVYKVDSYVVNVLASHDNCGIHMTSCVSSELSDVVTYTSYQHVCNM